MVKSAMTWRGPNDIVWALERRSGAPHSTSHPAHPSSITVIQQSSYRDVKRFGDVYYGADGDVLSAVFD